ncbi:murein biosynthesis integral membrane protein MurJ [Hamadaea tsunoensis]|uniref:murein biosynthesis integral membrane protein MurJ n=1 Tax=Hamadaea tsunoensis TaxID=53368 RepID=UPI00146FC10B|nr:murein biosynthesis integral membrane protein MurJ [Hamadaea tsunoensis]
MSRDPEQDWFPWDDPTGAYPRVDPDATMMLPQIVGESLPGAETELAVERTVRFGPVPSMNDATTVLRPIDDATTILPAVGGDTTVHLQPPPRPAPDTAPGTPTGPAESGQPRENTAAGNSAIMAIGSLVSRGTGFLRTAMIAAALGGVALGLGDAYTTAQFFPGMVYEFLIGGVLSSVVIPVLVRARRNDADGGEAYAQRLMTLTALVLGVAAILATLAAPLLTMIYTKSGTGDDYRNLVTALSYFTLPAIFFFGVSAVLSAYLNTRGVFGPPMWTPILNNIVVIATCVLYIVFFGAVSREAGDVSPAMVALLGGGTLLGITLQTAGLLPALHRAGFRWKARFDFRALGLRELAHLGGWMFCYVAVSQVGVLVMLRLLSGNSLLIYNNVYLLMMMAHGIVAVSIITALMPRMSAASAAGRLAELVNDLAKGVRTTSAMLAPIAVVFVFLAGPALVSLFARGAFTEHDASRGASVLIMAGISLIPFSLSQLFTFAFYALPDTKTPALLNIPVVLIRIIAQWVLFTIGLEAAGVMLGNGISYVIATALSIWQLHKRIGSLGLGRTAWTLARIVGAMVASGILGYLTVLVLRKIGIESSWIQLVLGGAVILAGYLAVAKGLRIEEIDDVFGLLGRVRRKLLRR